MPKFVSFIENQYIGDLEKQIESLEIRLKKADLKLAKELSKYLNQSTLQYQKLTNFLEDYKNNRDNWVLETTTYKKQKNNKTHSQYFNF